MIGEIIQGINSYDMYLKEKKNLESLQKDMKAMQEKPFPEYTLDPEMQKSYDELTRRLFEYENRERTGLSADQRAGINQGVATQGMINRENAVKAGGGQAAGYMAAMDTTSALNAALNAALEDARIQSERRAMTDSIRGQKIGMAGAIQGQKNLIVGAQQQRRQFMESMLGAAMRDTSARMFGARTGVGQSIADAEKSLQDYAMAIATMQGGGGGQGTTPIMGGSSTIGSGVGQNNNTSLNFGSASGSGPGTDILRGGGSGGGLGGGASLNFDN